MRSMKILCGMLLAMALSACATGPPAEHAERYRGTFEDSCSPVDAFATAFELWPESLQSLERVSIVLWPREGLAAGQRIRLGLREDGSGSLYRSATEWDFAEEGEIYFERYMERGSAAGWFWLNLETGQRLEGWFEANWEDVGIVYCG
jgi:hypothetical protein